MSIEIPLNFADYQIIVGPFMDLDADLIAGPITTASYDAIVTKSNGINITLTGPDITLDTYGISTITIPAVDLAGVTKLTIVPISDYGTDPKFIPISQNIITRLEKVIDAMQGGTDTLKVSLDNTFYVDSTSGSDSNDGLSKAKQFKTIAKALTSMSNGDTIIVTEYSGGSEFDLVANFEGTLIWDTPIGSETGWSAGSASFGFLRFNADFKLVNFIGIKNDATKFDIQHSSLGDKRLILENCKIGFLSGVSTAGSLKIDNSIISSSTPYEKQRATILNSSVPAKLLELSDDIVIDRCVVIGVTTNIIANTFNWTNTQFKNAVAITSTSDSYKIDSCQFLDNLVMESAGSTTAVLTNSTIEGNFNAGPNGRLYIKGVIVKGVAFFGSTDCVFNDIDVLNDLTITAASNNCIYSNIRVRDGIILSSGSGSTNGNKFSNMVYGTLTNNSGNTNNEFDFLSRSWATVMHNVYYVDSTNGDDLKSGLSKVEPFKTLSKAFTAVSNGDTIQVIDYANAALNEKDLTTAKSITLDWATNDDADGSWDTAGSTNGFISLTGHATVKNFKSSTANGTQYDLEISDNTTLDNCHIGLFQLLTGDANGILKIDNSTIEKLDVVAGAWGQLSIQNSQILDGLTRFANLKFFNMNNSLFNNIPQVGETWEKITWNNCNIRSTSGIAQTTQQFIADNCHWQPSLNMYAGNVSMQFNNCFFAAGITKQVSGSFGNQFHNCDFRGNVEADIQYTFIQCTFRGDTTISDFDNTLINCVGSNSTVKSDLIINGDKTNVLGCMFNNITIGATADLTRLANVVHDTLTDGGTNTVIDAMTRLDSFGDGSGSELRAGLVDDLKHITGTSGFSRTTDSLEALGVNTASAIASAVWEETRASHLTISTTGADSAVLGMAISYDFTTYSTSGPVQLFWSGVIGTGSPTFWRQVKTSTGGIPANTSEIERGEIIRDFAADAPT